jgi:hypothetical protein
MAGMLHVQQVLPCTESPTRLHPTSKAVVEHSPASFIPPCWTWAELLLGLFFGFDRIFFSRLPMRQRRNRFARD